MDVAIKRYRFSAQINQELKPLHELDNWHGILAVIIDYLVIGAAILASLYSYWFYPLTLIMIGSRQRALATLLHESVHAALARNKKLNYLLGTYFSGFLILQNFSSYTNSHVKKHHAFLGDKNLDPDYKYHLDLKIYEEKGPEKKLIRIF